jgi:hypothetical protein
LLDEAVAIGKSAEIFVSAAAAALFLFLALDIFTALFFFFAFVDEARAYFL